MTRSRKDPFAAARRYAGKNSGPNPVNTGTSVHGVNVQRAYIRPPGTRDYDQLGWNGRKTSQD